MRVFNYFLIFFMTFGFSGFSLLSQDAQTETEQEQTTDPQAAEPQVQEQKKENVTSETGKDNNLISGLLVPEDTNLSPEEQEKKTKIRQQEALWKNPDYRPYNDLIERLNRFSKSYSNNQFRLALSNYQSGLNRIIKAREKIENFRKEEAEKIRLNEKWYWQKVDRRDSEERYLSRLRDEAKLKAIVYFSKSVSYLDNIIDEELKNRDEYLQLKSNVLRSLIRSQYDIGNYPQCIPLLNLYISMGENEKEYPAHKYLANSYAFQEASLLKNGLVSQDFIYKIKVKKNNHFLRSAELRYGKASQEYDYVIQTVNRDEITTRR